MSTLITGGELRRDIRSFVAFKRRVGFLYKEGEASLRRFERFVEPILRKGPRSLKEITDRYIAEGGNRTSPWFRSEVGRVRQFCLYRHRYDSRAYVPEPFEGRAKRKFIPYLLSQDEVRKTLIAARRYRGKKPRCYGETAYLLVLICYCTGLRIGEAARLKLDDVNVKACTFRIRNSKRRTRMVPFRKDLSEKIQEYLKIREGWVQSKCETTALLLLHDGCALGRSNAHGLLMRIWRQMGLKPPRGRAGGPRPTDLRHAFARGRLDAWDRNGINVKKRLPWLSAYMGHKKPLATEVYLHSTPELLRRSSRRFERVYKQAGAS